MIFRASLWMFALGLLCCFSRPAGAQESLYRLRAVNTSSPRDTLDGFLTAMHDAYQLIKLESLTEEQRVEARAVVQRIVDCLDLSQIPDAVRPSLAKEAAVCLKEILDRIQLPPREEWPGPDQVRDQELDRWRILNTNLVIVRIPEGPRQGEFLFSAATVARAPNDYELIRSYPYVERAESTPGCYDLLVSEPGWMIPNSWIPDWSRRRIAGQAIWQWIGLTVTLAGTGLAMLGIYIFGRRRSVGFRGRLGRYVTTLIFPLAAMCLPLTAEYIIVHQLNIFGDLVVTLSFLLQTLFLLSLVIFVISVGNRLAELIIVSKQIQPAGFDAQLARLGCRLGGILGAAIVVLEGGQRMGIPLTTLLAGASVSGLALALAAQDSLRNILGSMLIMLDKPFRIGERIVAKGYDGVVEDIGLRSTRIRLLSGHQVSVPNEEMARIEIENVGRRPFIRRTIKIELPSDTPSRQIERALQILRELVQDHDGMDPSKPPRVNLRDVHPSSLGIQLDFWYFPPNYWEALALGEKLTLEMTRRFEAEAISFASPALTIHQKSGSDTLPSNPSQEDSPTP